jgi:hypothetical protein
MKSFSPWNPEGREALIAWRKARSIAFNSMAVIKNYIYNASIYY